MADGRSLALYEVLGRLAEAVGDEAGSGEVAQRVCRLEESLGPSAPTRFTGAPGTELAQATRWLDDADRALVRFGEIDARLPELQAAAERHSKDARGKWILLAAVGAILLAILVGQVI